MRRSGQPVLQGGNGAWNEPQAGLFLLLMPISITTEAPKRSAAFGSGTLDTVDTVITLKSVPTTRDVPDDGRIAAEIAEDPATKVVPSDRRKLVWLSVAVKMASVNKDVSGNCTGSVGLKAPGPKSPSGITTGEPLPISVSEPPRNVRKSVTGKSGGRANPPENRSPVKSKILKTSTPDMLMSLGIRSSDLHPPPPAHRSAGPRDARSLEIDLQRSVERELEWLLLGMHLTQVAPGSMVAKWKTTRERYRSSRPASRPRRDVASTSSTCGGRRLPMPTLRRWQDVVGGCHLVPVYGLRLPGLGDGWHGVPGHAEASGGLVSGDVVWAELDLGGLEEGTAGRGAEKKALIVIAAEADGKGIGRIRMRMIQDASAASLHPFIEDCIEPASTVHTDGWQGYAGLQKKRYDHEVTPIRGRRREASTLLPRGHLVVSLLTRWLAGTHQGAVSHDHLPYYLGEFTFRFNRRRSKSRGKLFFRLVQQAVTTGPTTYSEIAKPPKPLQSKTQSVGAT